MTTILLALLLVAAQADEVPGLIDRLRSDSAEERTRAEVRLKELGPAAVPALRKAASGSDADHAARAKRLLAVIGLRETLSARLRTERPGVEERLAVGAPRSWTTELLEILAARLFPPGRLLDKDVAPLIAPALQGAETAQDRITLLETADHVGSAESIPEAIRLFEDKDEGVRRTAARVCGRVGGPDVFRGLARLLRKGGADAVETCREALHSMGWEEQLSGYLELLAKAEVVERIDLLAVLRHASPILPEVLLNRWRLDDAVRRQLRPLFRALDPDVAVIKAFERDHCSEVDLDECPVKVLLLGDFEAAAAKAAVQAALGSENSYHRRMAAHLAGELGLKEAEAPLLRLLQDPQESRARSAAAIALSKLGFREQAPAIAALLKDPDQYVRGDAAESLGRLGASDHAAGVVELLRDPSEWTRERAARAFGGLGAGQADAVLRLLAAEDHGVRRAAALALGSMGVRSALPKIAASLDDPEDRVSLLGSYSLLGTKEDVPKVRALIPPSGGPSDPIEGALWKIGLRDPGTTPVLLDLLRDHDTATRGRAARTLARMGEASAAGRLAEALGDPEPDVRVEAALALGVLGAKDAAGGLEKALADPRSEVRHAAASSLCRLGVRRGLAPFLETRNWMSKLTSPNALRNPEEWRRWAGKRLDRDVRGPFRLVLGRLAARAGVRIDLSQVEEYLPDNLWATAQEGSTLIDALDHALLSASAEVLLEPGVLKLVHTKDADEFWRKWKD